MLVPFVAGTHSKARILMALFWATLFALVTLVLAAAFPNQVGGAKRSGTYVAQRQGLFVFARVTGSDFDPLRIRYKLQCSDDRHRVGTLLAEPSDIRIKPRTGSFFSKGRNVFDTLDRTVVLQGRVANNRLAGRISDRRFVSPGGGRPSYSCWTGRSKSDSSVIFIAKRVDWSVGGRG